MKQQSYANHRMFRPMFHYFLFAIVVSTLIGSAINLVKSTGTDNMYSASLIMAIAVALLFMFFFMRIFALRAQDRAIRAEENLRHFALTGKLLDTRLRMGQIIALRFAPDDEFAVLAKRAADENLSNDEIKRSVKNWRPDHHRA
jgi:hypothetical protein